MNLNSCGQKEYRKTHSEFHSSYSRSISLMILSHLDKIQLEELYDASPHPVEIKIFYSSETPS